MAKKASKRAGSKSTKKTGKKTVKRAGTGSGGGMFKVSTGPGPGPAEVGADVVAMFNAGKFRQIEEKWWSPRVESIEGAGVNLGWRGRAAVEAKNQGWLSEHTLLGASAEGPYVGSSGFAIRFRMEILEKATGARTLMEEVGVYTVQGGKIVREEFMYGPKTEQASAGSAARG